MDKYLAGGITLFAGLWGAKSLLKKRFGSESKREALNRAKGLNQMIDIDLVFENKFNKNNPLYRRFTFGKLNNIPESAEYKYAYVLPLTKSGKIRSNGKIHVAGIYPSENNEKFKIQELMCGQGDHRWIETDEFSKFKPMFYPVRIIEKNKKAKRANYRNEIGTGNYPDLELSMFYDRLEQHDIMCKKCAKAVNNYHKGTFFYNQKGVIKESESKREALNRAKGLNEMVIIERIRNFKEHDIISKFKFGKLNNPAKSASESLLFALPVKKDGQMKDKGKIHIGSFNSSHLDDVNPSNSDYYPFTYAGNTCQLIEGKEKKIPISDFKDKTSLYYPISIEDIIVSKDGEIINKRIYTVTRNLEAQTFAERFWWQNKLFCQKCHNYCLMRGINKEDYFINPNRQIYESESKINSELQKHFDILDKDKKEESIGELVDWDRKPKEPAYFEDVEWGQNSDD